METIIPTASSLIDSVSLAPLPGILKGTAKSAVKETSGTVIDCVSGSDAYFVSKGKEIVSYPSLPCALKPSSWLVLYLLKKGKKRAKKQNSQENSDLRRSSSTEWDICKLAIWLSILPLKMKYSILSVM